MLAQDYILKQLTASLIYPEKDLGKEFWNKVYTKAQQLYGTTEIPVNTFNKVWIVADKADVFEKTDTAYVVGAHLKVMLEEDYMAKEKHQETGASTISSKVVREVILPEIEKEVNEGRNFAPLRQIFNSMILASWYKMTLKDAILTQIYGNQSKVKVGINADDPAEKDKIFERYLQAYKKGVFNYIKEDINKVSQQPMPRKYFSGGEDLAMLKNVVHKVRSFNSAMLAPADRAVIASVAVTLDKTGLSSAKDKLITRGGLAIEEEKGEGDFYELHVSPSVADNLELLDLTELQSPHLVRF